MIWDVGLGAAANAMAAIQCYEEQAALGPVRCMRLISFENDLDSLRLALRHDDKFPYLRHAGPVAILEKGEWQSKRHAGLSWQLVTGDFLETVRQAPLPPDLIFYDMFSSKTHGEQWTIEIFQRLFAACRGPGDGDVYLHAFDRGACRSSRRRILCREGSPRRSQGRNHDRPHTGRRLARPPRVDTNFSPRNGSGAGIVLTPNSRRKFPPSKSRPSRN